MGCLDTFATEFWNWIAMLGGMRKDLHVFRDGTFGHTRY